MAARPVVRAYSRSPGWIYGRVRILRDLTGMGKGDGNGMERKQTEEEEGRSLPSDLFCRVNAPINVLFSLFSLFLIYAVSDALSTSGV